MAVFLLLSYFQPIFQTAFAQSSSPDQSSEGASTIENSSDSTPSESSVTQDETPAVEQSQPVDDNASPVITKQLQLQSEPPIAENKWLNSYADPVRLPQGFTNSGAFTHEVPIFTPPGRNGIEPNLKLTYNIQDKDTENIFGWGWSVNIPYIERVKKNGIDQMYSQSYFTSSFDGELSTTTTANVYGAKFDDGSFREYYFENATSSWIVTDKLGTQYSFGTSSDARLVDPNDSDRVFRWMLQKVEDTNGNTMIFGYTKDTGQVYPSTITYTANDSSPAPFEVDFIKEARSEDIPSYKHGFLVETDYRISDISVKFNGSEVHHYDLGYTTGHNGVRSLLQTITESGVGDAGTTTLPSMTFGYQDMNVSWATSTATSSLPDLADEYGKDLGFRVFNYSSSSVSSLFRFATDTPNKRYQGPDWTEYDLPDNYPILVDKRNHDRGGAIADVNGDRYLDIVLGKGGTTTQEQSMMLSGGGSSESQLLGGSASEPPTDILQALDGKTASERAQIKSQEIAKLKLSGTYDNKQYGVQVEIVGNAKAIEVNGQYGIELFARAWKDGKQLGFGKDGSVGIERFRFFNPPILVDDPNGDIVKEWTNPMTGEKNQRSLREDPVEAIKQSLAHTIKLVGKEDTEIVIGKIGNTTDNFYPDAHPESTTVDGYVGTYANAPGTSWDHIISNPGDYRETVDDLSKLYLFYSYGGQSGNYWRNYHRGGVLFNTSTIGSDTIYSATLSLAGTNKLDLDNNQPNANIYHFDPLSNTAIVEGDYNRFETTEFSTSVSYSNLTTDGSYTDFTLNSNGIAAISTSSVSKFGIRNPNYEVANQAPTNTGDGDRFGWEVDAAETGGAGTSQDPKLVVVHSGPDAPPSPPTDLLAEGSTNPTDISDPTPEFSAIYNDADSGDNATHYEINVSTSSDFATLKWDSGQTALASSTPAGARIADVSYSGTTLASSTIYYWRIKFWDNNGAGGDWSTTTSTFSLAALAIQAIQNISFVYDANGNITQITDYSDTGTGKTITYDYDGLNRLTSASTTAASSTPFSQTYSYSSIGNITNKSDVGDYTYAGTNYANPHAATSINGVTYTYDNNGNLTSYGTTTLEWDYNNRLISSGNGVSTTTYGYDHTGQRVKKTSGGVSTIYPNQYYNVAGATTTKHIFAGSDLIATKEGNNIYYIHTDHLGGSNVETNANGQVVESTDYYPYGSMRINESTGFNEQRKFTGHEYDDESDLTYANARYYNQNIARWISQDPSFINLGHLEAQLRDPQLMNSYAYARNNPLRLSDPNGQMPTAVAGALIGGGIGLASQFSADLISGHWSSWQTYAGATAGGAVQGLLWGSGAGILALTYKGALSGLVQGGTRELLNYASGNGFNLGSVGADVGISAFSNMAGGALLKWVGVPAIEGITSGRNSFDAITKQIFTKLENGTISSVTLSTQAKMGVSFMIKDAYSIGIQTLIEARQQAAQGYNAAQGASTGGGGTMPSNNSLWVTPSGAVVTWLGQLVVGPAVQSTPMTK